MYEKYAENALRLLGESGRGTKYTLRELCRELGMILKTVEGETKAAGYAVLVDERAYILLSTRRSAKERQFALAHEAAHILLGHLGDYMGIRGRELSKAEQENEANDFAVRILSFLSKNI